MVMGVRTPRRRALVSVLVSLLVVALVVLLAAAWLVLPRTRPRPRGRPADAQASAARLEQTVRALPTPRSAWTAESLLQAESFVEQRLQAGGWTVLRQKVDHGWFHETQPETLGHGHPPLHNLLVSKNLRGSGPLKVLAAHLDTRLGTPGADDNGSGVAVLLEVARLLESDPAAGGVVLLFFNEEEEGLLGSRHWVRTLDPRLKRRIAQAVVLESVGYTSSRQGGQRYPAGLERFAPDTGDFLAALALLRDRGIVESLVDARDRAAPGLRLVTFTPPRFLADRLPDFWRSDHAPLVRSGIPTALLTDTAEFRNPNYHGQSDLPGTLDYPFMAQVADALAAWAREPP